MVARKLTYPDITETTTITTTTVGCKRKAETEDPPTDVAKKDEECDRKAETKDTPTDAVKKDEEDEEEVDIFSEDSKRILSTRISKCQCGGWRICGPCDKKYPATARETVDKTPPLLCNRDCEDGSKCTDDYTTLPVFPCTICKKNTDDGDVSTDWHLDCEQARALICDNEMCPGCLGVIREEVCNVCNYNCDFE